MSYIVYIMEMDKNYRSYRRTKKRCATHAEAVREQERLMEETGKFHEIREVDDNPLDLDPGLARALSSLQRESGMRTLNDFED